MDEANNDNLQKWVYKDSRFQLNTQNVYLSVENGIIITKPLDNRDSTQEWVIESGDGDKIKSKNLKKDGIELYMDINNSGVIYLEVLSKVSQKLNFEVTTRFQSGNYAFGVTLGKNKSYSYCKELAPFVNCNKKYEELVQNDKYIVKQVDAGIFSMKRGENHCSIQNNALQCQSSYKEGDSRIGLDRQFSGTDRYFIKNPNKKDRNYCFVGKDSKLTCGYKKDDTEPFVFTKQP